MPRKKDEIEKEMEIEKAIAEEFSENDDIVDYIEGKSLDNLKKRYSVADEDEEIRNEGFELAQKNGLFRKKKPSGYGYYYSPQAINNPDEIKSTAQSPLSKLFDSAQSEFDNDNVSFGELNLDEPAPTDVVPENFENELSVISDEKSLPLSHPVAEETTPEEKPAPKKRGRPKKITEPVAEEATPEENPAPKKRGRPKKVVEPVAETATDSNETITIKKVYNTNTKVIFLDENTDDGIKRTDENEVSSAFASDDENKKPKRRGLFGFFHRRKKS